ncbi:hypothetical protein CHS0354_003187 [Potamilus streckersoni]|uniref:Arf-GAP domain-containing protein n=1 Tax=Potamilus streckersoni TaxID=2493646 RepID=A0AAE0RYA5_9BIVA|nr:hypothetical protein CHS0354_003187 [Potamilus streckersoni]
MADQPTKADIQAIFKRLRSIPTNKQCFDCGSSNPTWASVTYGVFLCIDCSAVHRSLGVHVTFIRSTQLDTNWTWLQLRAMQVGGNANATAFFRHHGCTTKDAQQKYHSRAASMYRDKLHSLATQAMKLHGTKLHIDSQHDPTSPEAKEVDFFAEHAEFQEPVLAPPVSYTISDSAKLSSEPLPIQNGKTSERTEPTEGPSVEAALSMSPTQAQAQAEPRKAIIGAKKPTAAKKGKFGAQKVKTNFSEIESRAHQMDKDRETLSVASSHQDGRSVEEQEKQLASMRLAYQDMTFERKKQEEKLKVTDPKKAEQMERLGMGFGGNKGISHSAMSDMKTIEQEAPASSSKSSFDRFESSSRKDFFEDEFEVVSSGSGFSSGPPKYDSPFVSDRTRKDDLGIWGTGSNKSSSWDMDRFESKQQSFSETLSSKEDERPSRNRKAADTGSSTDEAQKKFGNAKSISSNQFFGDKDPDFEVRQNLSKYEGSSSISSSDIFGTEEKHRKSYSYSNAPDLQDIKDGVRQGVTKVAGKLSTLANGVMSSLQRK